jgi:hypothetical protein
MPLYLENQEPHVAPEAAVVIVHRFVTRCREWALKREIPARTQRVAASADATEAAKLHAWTAYAAFLTHTLEELEQGTLDHWFTGEHAPPQPPPRDEP